MPERLSTAEMDCHDASGFMSDMERRERIAAERTVAQILAGTSLRVAAGSMDAEDFPVAPEPVPVRLNLGAGPHLLPGWDNLDRKDGREVYPLDFPDDFAREIRASHVLEHFSHRDVGAVLAEWVRVLRPGGTLRVAVPDFEWIAQQYLAGQPINVQGYVMGGHVDDDDRHGTIFDREELAHALRAAGLWDVRPWTSEVADCASLPVSLNLQGKKKGPLPPLRIKGAMSVPRLGFQDNFYCWFEALAPLGILPTKYDGAFWGQCLERVLSDQLDADYVLTVDYDSVFTREHVEDLIRLAVLHPEADAIAPLQIRRKGEAPLVTIKGGNGKPLPEIGLDQLQADLLPVSTAHFGLTLLKTSALKRMPHPWLLGVPGPDGTWGAGRLDDDVYFWRKWEETGNSLFLAPHVVCGHGEFVVTWPRRGDCKPIHQHPSDFWEKGLPEEAWR